jgi:hypothetical protein
MAQCMDALLAQTPVKTSQEVLDIMPRDLSLYGLPDKDFDSPKKTSLPSQAVLHEPVGNPKKEGVESVILDHRCPMPDEPIFVLPQTRNAESDRYVEAIGIRDAVTQAWEASQKEPLVEVPVKRTKQYFSLVREMEEYTEKRAAQVLDGIDGKTMPEKEDGIKRFELYFGGLRHLEGREKFQGVVPWNREISNAQRRELIKREEERTKLAEIARRQPPRLVNKHTEEFTPVDSSGIADSTAPTSGSGQIVGEPKERVVWRFEDVSWVKQRNVRPRKYSYAGRLDHRVSIESGMARYGPYGIGGGVEGVGGIKQVLERGIDGELRIGDPIAPKKKQKREIIF